MKWDLETRRCVEPKCGRRFRVLPKSKQDHCCIPHNPTGPKTFAAAAKANFIKRSRENKQKLTVLIDRMKELYAAGYDTATMIDILNIQGFRKPKGRKPIDAQYLGNIRYKFKIRVPTKAKPS